MLSPRIRRWFATSMVGVALLGISELRAQWPTAIAATNEIWTTKPSSSALKADIDTQKLNEAFTHLAQTLSPTVVNIYTRTGVGANSNQRFGRRLPLPEEDFEFFFGNPFGGPMRPREAQALGSGFVISTEGYIVTNAHVVRMAGHDADEIMVKLIGEDSQKGHPAKVIGADDATDIALLKLLEPVPNLKAAPLGDSDRLKVGEWVVAIGNPYGHAHTVTQGIVSAIGRSLQGVRNEFIQTSASINPGNSGGPLINLAGEVIAINAAIDPRAQGIGFAIPANTAKNVITQLMQKGKVSRGWLGLAIEDYNDDIRRMTRIEAPERVTQGVLIRNVVPQEPAALAGLAPYDIITRVNGQDVKSGRDLIRMVEKIGIGQTADIEVVRGRQFKNFKVRVGEQPSDQKS